MVLTPTSPTLEITASEQLADWLHSQQISLAFTTYQTNRLFFIGSNNGRIAAHERLFDKPMGLYANGDRLYMSTRSQIWRLDNLLTDNETYGECDRLYVPRTAHVTGDLNIHDLVIANPPLCDLLSPNRRGAGGEVKGEGMIFVNTDFSCLATVSDGYSFVPIWQPPFISKLVAEDRCHLNGLALRDGKPAYVTACSTTDTAAGWRNCRDKGGTVIDVQSNAIVATGLSMPHSPRWYRDKLWLLNSGTGELGYIESGQFVPLTFCPGFVRGLAFWDNYAVVGLSKLRARPVTGLVLEERLALKGKVPHCGLMVIDLDSGKIVHWLHLEGIIEELFDVVILPGICQPKAIGFQKDEIERLVTFPGSDGIVITKPTVERPSLGARAPVVRLPRTSETLEPGNHQELATPFPPSPFPPSPIPIKYQRVYHLNQTYAVAYDALTFPSLQQRWLTQPQRGELLGISASVNGEIVGMVIAELLPEGTAELISLLVVPSMRQQGIGTRLVHYLERELAREGYERMQAIYPASNLPDRALSALWCKLNWQSERLSQTVQTAFKAIA